MEAEVTTKRLILRPLATKHAADLFTIRSYEEVHKQIHSGPFPSLAAAEIWITETTAHPRSLIFAVSVKDSYKVIGIVGLNRFGTIHYLFHPDFWNRGYCTEALDCFLATIFAREPKRRRIGAVVQGGNMGSMRVLVKSGFLVRWKGEAPGVSMASSVDDDIRDDFKPYSQELVASRSESGRLVEFRYFRPVDRQPQNQSGS